MASGKILYITIGPQNGGKTTRLRDKHCEDIAIDDFPGLISYVPWKDLNEANAEALAVHDALVGDISGEELIKRIVAATKGSNEKLKTRLATLTASAVAKVKAAPPNVPMSNTAEVLNFKFIPTAVNGSLARLEDVMKRGEPVAWGNTNKVLKDMHDAVGLADKHGYSVEFIPCTAPLDTLIERNVGRLWRSGKYIPVAVLAQTHDQVENLLKTGVTLEAIRASGGHKRPRVVPTDAAAPAAEPPASARIAAAPASAPVPSVAASSTGITDAPARASSAAMSPQPAPSSVASVSRQPRRWAAFPAIAGAAVGLLVGLARVTLRR